MRTILPIVVSILLTVPGLARAAAVEVVGTLPIYAEIAEEIGGDRVEARAIAEPNQDAHFVKPKPSLALMLRRADLFVTTGLDLELWAPTLVDKSGNREIRAGEVGYVNASQGVPLLDIPESASREAGDVHVYGNPHLHTSPLNVEVYRTGLEDLRHRIDVALYGAELVELLGSERLDPLARNGKLFEFLSSQEYQGAPLLERLGGWLGEGRIFRGREIIAYHKNWIYFTDLFGLEIVDYVEPKPGIPPSARHVHELIQTIEKEEIPVILTANYFDPRKPAKLADRTGATALIVPLEPGGEAESYFDLIDLWVDGLARAFGGGS